MNSECRIGKLANVENEAIEERKRGKKREISRGRGRIEILTQSLGVEGRSGAEEDWNRPGLLGLEVKKGKITWPP